MTHKAVVREQARELIREGHSSYHVAAVIGGITSASVRRWARDGNWRLKKPDLTPLGERRLRILVDRGWGSQTISNQLRIYPRKLRRLMKERGLKFGPKSKSYALAGTLKISKMTQWENRLHERAERELAERGKRGELVY